MTASSRRENIKYRPWAIYKATANNWELSGSVYEENAASVEGMQYGIINKNELLFYLFTLLRILPAYLTIPVQNSGLYYQHDRQNTRRSLGLLQSFYGTGRAVVQFVCQIFSTDPEMKNNPLLPFYFLKELTNKNNF